MVRASQGGILVNIRPIAGDRRQAAKNYVDGSVKLGFVRARMTDGMDLPAELTAGREEVAAVVVKAIHRLRRGAGAANLTFYHIYPLRTPATLLQTDESVTPPMLSTFSLGMTYETILELSPD